MEISERSVSRSIKFWILLIFQIPSIICSIFLLHDMLFYRIHRRSIANHVIIIMLIVGFFSVIIDLSITLNYLREGIVNPQSKSFCFFWMYIDYSLYASGVLLTAWASIERYLLVFSIKYFRLTYQKILLHYLPISFFLIYPFIFYACAIFFYSSEQDFDFRKPLCGTASFKHQSPVLNWYDMITHSVLPSVLIVTFSLLLLIRIIRRKRHIQRQLFSWRRQRRLTRQLLFITCLYITVNVPLFIVVLIEQCCSTTFAIAQYSLYIFYLYYFLVLLLPFVCISSVDKLKKKFRKIKCCFRSNRIQNQPKRAQKIWISQLVPIVMRK